MIVLKQNDLLPTVDVGLESPSGTPVPLAGASVRFLMRNKVTKAVKVNAAATVLDATAGLVRYTWTGTDTNTAGLYEAEFEVTFAGGFPRTFPEEGFLHVKITDDIA